MKKLFAIATIVTALFATSANAQQGGGDPAARMAMMKERMKPVLVEKAKITDAQAEKVIEAQMESRSQMRGFRDLSEADRKKKMDEMQTTLNGKYKEMSLTEEQIKAINAVYDEQRRNMQQRQNGNGGGQQ